MTDEDYNQIITSIIEQQKNCLRKSNMGNFSLKENEEECGFTPTISKKFTGNENSTKQKPIKPKTTYHKEFTNRMIETKTADVYDVLNMFSITCPMVQHALKKLLVTGGRSGGKSEIQDLKEAAMSIEQAIQELKP